MPAFAITDNLDWTVSQRAVATMGFNGEWQPDPTTKAIHRDDTDSLLGYVSSGYESVQNADLLNLINPMVEEGLLTIENMGYLQNGAKVFAQAKINQEFRVIGESYNAYITLLNGHIGNNSVAIGPSCIRVICGNTFAMAYKDIDQKFRHHQGVNDRVLESTAVMDFVNGAMAVYSARMESLASSRCSIGQYHQFLEKVYQREVNKMRNVEKLNSLFYGGAGNEGLSYHDAYQAILDFSSNHSKKTVSGRFNYANFGQGRTINNRALNVLVDLVP